MMNLAAAAVIVSTIVVTAKTPAPDPSADTPHTLEAPPCGSSPVHRHAQAVRRRSKHTHPVHAALPYRVVNHHLVKATPAPGCQLGGPVTMTLWSPEPSADLLPALAIGPVDELTVPPVEQEVADDLGDQGGAGYGYGPAPFGFAPFPSGGGVAGGGGGRGGTPGLPVISPSPEPESWALMLFGLAFIGLPFRWRKQGYA